MKETLMVNEIFFSVQGESTYAGLPCVFVRLTYCNLRCTYCDTEYAFYEGIERSVEEVLKVVGSFSCNLVEITGGEPLFQPSANVLIRRLLDAGKTVLIETGGSLDVRDVDSRAILIYDIKCPDSGMQDRNRLENLEFLGPNDEIKFVVSSRRDYEWSREMVKRLALFERHPVLFSPVWEKLESKQLAEWILADGLPVRLQFQLHKLIWGAETKGV